MRKRAKAIAFVFATSPAVRAQPPADPDAAVTHDRGLNATIAALGVPGSDSKASGFLIAAGVERSTRGSDIDLGIGMSYLRVSGFGAPVKMFNFLDATMWHRSSVAYFIGMSMGVISSQGKDRFGSRLFGGVEFFHHDRLPVHVAVDLITKWCDDDEYHRCPQNEQAFWAAGRLGFRF